MYNALTFGVPGTAMASFDALSPADRWSLAFYVFRLGHAGAPAQGPVAMTLGDLAGRTDREIRRRWRARSTLSPRRAWCTRGGRPPSASRRPAWASTARASCCARRWLRCEAGRATEADRLVLDAYLQGFEPLEPRLRARDPQGVVSVEAGFRDLRAAVGPTPTWRARGRTTRVLEDRLERLAGEAPLLPLLAAFLIYFREGVEAALLVGALLAGLRRLGRGRRRALRPRRLAARAARGRRHLVAHGPRHRHHRRPAGAGGGAWSRCWRRRCSSRSASG